MKDAAHLDTVKPPNHYPKGYWTAKSERLKAERLAKMKAAGEALPPCSLIDVPPPADLDDYGR